MAEILRYVIVDADDHEEDYEYDELIDAKDTCWGRGEPLAIIERHYVYDDSELVWTSNGEDTWPPDDRRTTRTK